MIGRYELQAVSVVSEKVSVDEYLRDGAGYLLIESCLAEQLHGTGNQIRVPVSLPHLTSRQFSSA